MNKQAVVALVVMLATGPILAKLPPPNDEAKAKATQAAAKAAWTNQVGLYEVCQSMDRVAATYRSSVKAAGKEPPAADPMPACADPGPYVAPIDAPASKPLEASEAHSPAGMAVSPPSNKATSAEMTGPRK
ncbi:MAG: hypothetical protein ABI281_12825 [Caldimonas sp.]